MILLAGSWTQAQTLPLTPYSYREGWEAEGPELALWAKNGESTVAFAGPSEDRAFEGKRSYKLDVTLNGGSYHYFGVPLRVPCSGKLKLSGRLYLGEGTTATVGFGSNMVYPPSTHSGCGPEASFTGPTGEWKLIEQDLVERGESGADQVVRFNTVNVTGEDVGVYLDRWSLFIYGGEGQRAVIYLDDVTIKGEVPPEADYQAQITGRWTAAQQRLQARVADWRAALDKGEAALAEVKAPDLQDRIYAIRAKGEAARALVEAVEKHGQASAGEVQDIEAGVYALAFAPQTLAAISQAKAAGAPFLLYAPRAIANARLGPSLRAPRAAASTNRSRRSCTR
jgi:hypothetical protein